MTVVHAMLSNAVIAALLAVVALAVGRICRSPAVRHAAWVLVLLKLVTPPLISIPLTVLPASWAAQSPEPPPATFVFLATATAADSGGFARPASESAGWSLARPRGFAEWAVIVWVAGALTWFGWQGRRILRFRRRVAGADDAPSEIVAAANRLAAALGIAHPPGVKLATGIGSPMLWGWGRGVVVLLPRDLLARLSPEARDTLLAHELAHFLRRDHWVRVLEFIATGLYWWHPVVWLARAGIEAAEEECVDSWVVGGLAVSPRLYAEALLATVDYEAELRRPCLPPGACAANRSARLLRKRLFGLINADTPHRIRVGRVLWAIVIVALLIRPVLRAATPEPLQPPAAPVVVEAPRKALPARVPAITKATEPRAWATAAPPGGPTVLARDKELLVRFPDGTSRVLGPGRPIALAFAPGTGRMATAGPGPLVRTWDDRGSLLASVSGKAAARAVVYTPDGTRLLVLDAANTITVYDPRTLTPGASWAVEGPANSIACSPDGRTVAVSCGSWLAETGWVELWSIAERKKLATITAPGPVGASRFTPSGDTLIVGGWNGHIAWRSLPSGNLIAERQLTKDLVATTAFCPDAGTLPLEPPPEPLPPDTPERLQPFGLVPGP